jgi:hypothetical protein
MPFGSGDVIPDEPQIVLLDVLSYLDIFTDRLCPIHREEI